MNAPTPDLVTESRLPQIAVVCGAIGLCVFPFAVIAAVLSIVALVSIARRGGGRSGQKKAVTALILSAASVVTTGILAAIMIPAFISYTRRAKTMEATMECSNIFRALANRAVEDVDDGHGGTTMRGLPGSIPRTPSTPPCGPQPWPADAPAAWAELGYAPSGPVRFAYEIEADPAGDQVYVRATGDLDCDGTLSSFELAVGLDAQGEAYHARGFYIQNEIE